MRKDYFRYYKPQCLIWAVILSSSIIGTIMHVLATFLNNFLSEPYFQFPATSSLLVIVFILLDKNGLRFPLIKNLFWVKDISGRYEGVIEYVHFQTNERKTKPCVIEIIQSASYINVNSYFKNKFPDIEEKTESFSLVSSVIENDAEEQKLIFTYHNKGNQILKMPPYNGTNILSIKNQDNKIILEGEYYTDRNPQTKGIIRVELKTKQLKKEF
jgi:predicted pore-forming effector associated with SMODS systems